MRVYTTSLGWGILNRHFGDYCTGGDVTAPRALAQSEGLAGVAERSQFSRAVEGLPAGMSYPRWRNEANLRAWPELRNEANSGRLPTQCGPPVGMWYPRWRNEAKSEGLARVAERSQFRAATDPVRPPVGMWYPRWRNEANPRAWPELRNEANLERCSTHEYFTVPARHRAPGAAPKRGASWRAGSPFLDSRVAGGFGVFRVRTRK
jgi:hypothetical protein